MSKKKHKKEVEQSYIEEEIASETDVFTENSHSQLPWIILVGGVFLGVVITVLALRPFHREPMRSSTLFTEDTSWELNTKVSDFLEDADYIDRIVDIDYEFRTVVKYNEYSQEYSCMIVYEY